MAAKMSMHDYSSHDAAYKSQEFDNSTRRSFDRRSTVAFPGMEGKYVAKGQFSGKSIAVLSSGGDAQGMNSAIRAVVRMGLYCGCRVFFVKEGYQGLVDGGKNIREATWADVSGIMQLGGTVIGSARCKDFRDRAGREKAALNMVKHGIHNLVVIGGDGSLTGANEFRVEWASLLASLYENAKITDEEKSNHEHLNIVGIVGSIDNDFCGTDMTIGADSALHRVIEAADAIVTTAQSHQRCFILEVMGRNCGYLALISALASEADWVFIPEVPPMDNWPELLCSKVRRNRERGQRVSIIMIAEGAVDRENKPITCEMVQKLMVDELGLDTRITVLGHVQRGGRPSAFDRLLGVRMGAEAVLALMDADKNPDLPSCVITLVGNQAVRLPLMHCVEKTRAVAVAIAKRDFEQAVFLRGRSFMTNVDTYITLSKINPPTVENRAKLRVAVVNVGAPAGGVNAAMRSFTRIAITRGYHVVGIFEGFQGLVNGEVRDIFWDDVRGWVSQGGSNLGTRRPTPREVGLDAVATRLGEFRISGLLVIGGFEAFECMIDLVEGRSEHKELCIPMIMIPATISNNVPGTDFSLGADTALNEITLAIDKIKQSATGTKRRVFVVETMGGYCGYLATMGAVAGGADAAYIHEEAFGIDDLREDVTHLRAKMASNVQRGLVLRAELANKNYSTDFIHKLYSEEGQGIFDCRMTVLGHIQQGGEPSPFDRILGTKLGVLAIEWLDNQMSAFLNENGVVSTNGDETSVLLGLVKRAYEYSRVVDLKRVTDFKHRVPCDNWWLNLRPLMRIMAKHESLYESESIMLGADRI
uniref:ATP-dependent 6-phosphofructokinase n=1 Tax=Echinococcus granulosus TaxID=6210 RepID=A0A068WQ24_ECHGR|nr:6 phosphofructokinase [Echinococcus granulosus]